LRAVRPQSTIFSRLAAESHIGWALLEAVLCAPLNTVFSFSSADDRPSRCFPNFSSRSCPVWSSDGRRVLGILATESERGLVGRTTGREHEPAAFFGSVLEQINYMSPPGKLARVENDALYFGIARHTRIFGERQFRRTATRPALPSGSSLDPRRRGARPAVTGSLRRIAFASLAQASTCVFCLSLRQPAL